jgi:hypothetical protein
MRGGDDAAVPVGEEHRQTVRRQHCADFAGRARNRDVGFGCAAVPDVGARDRRAVCLREPQRLTGEEALQ